MTEEEVKSLGKQITSSPFLNRLTLFQTPSSWVAERFFQNLQGQIDFPLAHVQGREEADHFIPAAQKQETA